MSVAILTNSHNPMERKTKYRLLSAFVILAGAALTVILVGLLMKTSSMQKEVETAKLENQQLQLENQQLQLANEYQTLDAQFQQMENQSRAVKADPLVAKYEAAKTRIEKLLKELKDEKSKTAGAQSLIKEKEKRIKELEAEIATLKDILKHYVEQIDALGKENESLKAENAEVKAQNTQLTSQVNETRQKNEVLTEKMTLAEKLNVTGVSLTALNKKGKSEKNVEKAKQLMVSFTIPQNNSTPVGEKKIFLRITSPEGNLLGATGGFPFEGKQLQFTARKAVEYGGDEIAGIKMYWDVNTVLSHGDYLVELFTDGYRLSSRRFSL